MSDFPDVFIRYVNLPLSVKGVTLPNDDGSFDVYINSSISFEGHNEALAHELTHIYKNHFGNDIETIAQIEDQADSNTRLAAFLTKHAVNM